MAPKTRCIKLPGAAPIPILYEDRAVLALDKPAGWMLAPTTWRETGRNLHATILSSIAAGDFWARSRNLKYLRYVHRLDADTSGVLLFAKSAGGLKAYSRLFESRQVEKLYWAVVHGVPKQSSWVCRLKLAREPDPTGCIKADARHGRPAETHFRALQSHSDISLLEARPITGRTHQIRVHLAESGHPVLGDKLYGRSASMRPATFPQSPPAFPLALRAISLSYDDPFNRRRVEIRAPGDDFLRHFGFATL